MVRGRVTRAGVPAGAGTSLSTASNTIVEEGTGTFESPTTSGPSLRHLRRWDVPSWPTVGGLGLGPARRNPLPSPAPSPLPARPNRGPLDTAK